MCALRPQLACGFAGAQAGDLRAAACWLAPPRARPTSPLPTGPPACLPACSTAENPIGKGWEVCHNGTIHMGSVKGAVADFVRGRGLDVMATEEALPSFIIRKR